MLDHLSQTIKPPMDPYKYSPFTVPELEQPFPSRSPQISRLDPFYDMVSQQVPPFDSISPRRSPRSRMISPNRNLLRASPPNINSLSFTKTQNPLFNMNSPTRNPQPYMVWQTHCPQISTISQGQVPQVYPTLQKQDSQFDQVGQFEMLRPSMKSPPPDTISQDTKSFEESVEDHTSYATIIKEKLEDLTSFATITKEKPPSDEILQEENEFSRLTDTESDQVNNSVFNYYRSYCTMSGNKQPSINKKRTKNKCSCKEEDGTIDCQLKASDGSGKKPDQRKLDETNSDVPEKQKQNESVLLEINLLTTTPSGL